MDRQSCLFLGSLPGSSGAGRHCHGKAVVNISNAWSLVVCGLVTSPSWISHNCQGSSQVLGVHHQHCCICPTTKGSCSLLVSKSPACSCSKVNLLHLAIQELDVSNQAVFEALQFKPQNVEDSYAMACIWSRASTTVSCLTVYCI